MAAPTIVESPRVRSRPFATLTDNPDYRRFYIGQGVSLIGTWMQGAAISWIVFDMTGSKWWLGVVEAANIMPGLFVGLVAGALADRVWAKGLVLITLVGQMLLAFVLASLVGVGIAQIWQMIVILALARVCIAFEMPSRQVFLFEIVGRSQLTNAIALNVGLFNASRVIGPALAGVCLWHLGTAAPFWINGLTYVAAIAAVLSIRSRRAPKTSTGKGFGDILGGLRYLRENRKVARTYGLMTFFGIAGMGYSAMLSAYAVEVIGTRELGYSFLLACGGVGATLGALFVAWLGGLRRQEHLILGGMIVFSIALALAGVLPNAIRTTAAPWWPMVSAAISLLGAGFGAILFYSSAQTLIQTTVPDHLRGRIMGVWMIVFSGSIPLGALWTGRLAQAIGVEPVLILSASICLLAAGFVYGTGFLNQSPTA